MFADGNLWCSPDFTATIRVGSEEDHALLMASIFRTVKHEDLAEFNKWAKKIRANTTTRKDRDKELLTVELPKNEGEEKEQADGDEEEKANIEGAETKEGTDGGTTEGKTEKEDDKKKEEAEKDNVDDRVFVCMGKATDGSEKKQVWVMTINRTFDEVTFWDAKQHKHYVLKHRIQPEESTYL